LIEDNVDAAVLKAFAKSAHTLSLLIIGLAVANEDL
jgi:hypothetical protein